MALRCSPYYKLIDWFPDVCNEEEEEEVIMMLEVLQRQRNLEKYITENKIDANYICTVMPSLSPNKRVAKLKEDLRLYDEINELLSSLGLDVEQVHKLHNRLAARPGEKRNAVKEES
eukprot:3097099-Rhodomonas_salina.1